MGEISCKVIQDLLPSYVDEICSEDSKDIVEAHLEHCTECRAYKEGMIEELALPSIDMGALDHLKKIRYSIDVKMTWLFGILVAMATGFFVTLDRPIYFFVILPVLLVCNYFIGSEAEDGPCNNLFLSKGIIVAMIGNVVLIGGMLILMTVLVKQWILTGQYPFGMAQSELGPFVHRCLWGIFIIEVGLWIATRVYKGKLAKKGINLSEMSVVGYFGAVYYMRMLKELSSASKYDSMSQIGVWLAVEGLIIIGILSFVHWKRRKSKE